MTSAHDLPYAVIGATGQQGGAVVDALLAASVPVRGLVRDTGADDSVALARRGVSTARADQDDPASLEAAMTDVAAVFIMTTFAGPKGTEGEVEHGKAIIDAAVRANVPRAVYASVGGAERHTGIPHFDSKGRIEEYARASSLPCSFVRPTFFYENLGFMADTDHDEIAVRVPMPDGVALQMVAVHDIGVVSAAALLDPSVLPGDAIEIAGDELTGAAMADAYAKVYGKPARYEPVPVESLNDPDQEAMFRWFVDASPSYIADFDATRRIDPDVLDLAGWIARTRNG